MIGIGKVEANVDKLLERLIKLLLRSLLLIFT